MTTLNIVPIHIHPPPPKPNGASTWAAANAVGSNVHVPMTCITLDNLQEVCPTITLAGGGGPWSWTEAGDIALNVGAAFTVNSKDNFTSPVHEIMPTITFLLGPNSELFSNGNNSNGHIVVEQPAGSSYAEAGNNATMSGAGIWRLKETRASRSRVDYSHGGASTADIIIQSVEFDTSATRVIF